ncbi:NAD(P)H-hydrate epimerase [Candidatus Micrarchaeota archaeon]|nr:NAD(P)H-hydrate epimerase [Candidatus Micrarchaeota archaeon]
MKTISAEEMHRLEENAFAKGVTVLELMEKAGKRCAQIIESKLGTGKKIVIFCGPGNNGGDGLVCARYLHEKNDVFVVALEPKTEAAKINYKRAKETGVKFIGIEKVRDCDIVIDALLGIGAMGTLRGEIKEMCKKINSMKAYKISIDVPTGARIDEDAIKADVIIAIHAPKIKGKQWVVDIGL